MGRLCPPLACGRPSLIEQHFPYCGLSTRAGSSLQSGIACKCFECCAPLPGWWNTFYISCPCAACGPTPCDAPSVKYASLRKWSLITALYNSRHCKWFLITTKGLREKCHSMGGSELRCCWWQHAQGARRRGYESLVWIGQMGCASKTSAGASIAGMVYKS